MLDYNSSEEIQRHRAEVFARQENKKPVSQTETEKLVKVLDKYIEKHQTTRGVRDELKRNPERSIEVQFGISDGIIEILEKIKGELR